MRLVEVRRSRAKPDKIDDFKDTERVDEEECDEPPLLAIAGGVPERIPFDRNSPQSGNDEEGEESEHESRQKRC